jgi:hypothetical protein
MFVDYIRTVLVSSLTELGTLEEFVEETAILLMDNCLGYVTTNVIVLLTAARMRVMTFAPRRTQIFQVLDDFLCCSQTASKMRIAFRRRESNREIPNESISRLQTNNGGT